jgi:hypothetical protein
MRRHVKAPSRLGLSRNFFKLTKTNCNEPAKHLELHRSLHSQRERATRPSISKLPVAEPFCQGTRNARRDWIPTDSRTAPTTNRNSKSWAYHFALHKTRCHEDLSMLRHQRRQPMGADTARRSNTLRQPSTPGIRCQSEFGCVTPRRAADCFQSQHKPSLTYRYLAIY